MPRPQAPAAKLPRYIEFSSPGLPVFKIIGRALVFEATHLFTLFRLTWLPLAALLATQVAAGQLIAQATGAASTGDFETGQRFVLDALGVLLQALPFTAVATSVHRLVYFDDRRPGVYFAFAFGATELRYLASCIAVIALAGLPVAVTMALAYLTRAVELGGALVVMLLAGYVFFIFMTLRLLILPAQTVATGRLSIRDAFSLSQGHTISLLLVVVTAGACFLIGAVVLPSLFGFDGQDAYFALLERPEMFGWIWLPNWDRFMQPPTPPVIALEFALSFLISTFVVTCLSFAYLALKQLHDGDGATDEPEPA
jgi:hypothetical protein